MNRVRGRLATLRTTAVPIAQCAGAASLAWLVATEVVGHARPFFAPISAIIALGVGVGGRGRRAVEVALGVALGILVGDLLIALIGTGTAQIALVVVLLRGLGDDRASAVAAVRSAAGGAREVLDAPGDHEQLDRLGHRPAGPPS